MIKKIFKQHNKLKHLYLFALLQLPTFAASQTSQEMNNQSWHLGLQVFNHVLRSEESSNLLGSGAKIQLGYSCFMDQWMTGLSLDFISGPFTPPEGDDIRVDSSGTGATAYFAYNLSSGLLREEKLKFGLIGQLNYSDLVGRSIGQNINISEDEEVLNSWVMRVNNFTFSPGIFISWFKQPRPLGTKPELLMTRLEGGMVYISYSIPIRSTYKVEEDYTNSSNSSSGPLKGHSWLVGITSYLGS